MAVLSEQKFRFHSMAQPGDTFSVIRFAGSEGLNALYEFDIELVSQREDLDLTEILESPATFTVVRPQGDVPFSGILKFFEQRQKVGRNIFYRAVLAPKLWWLTLTQHNQVFLNKSAPQFLAELLRDGGLQASDFEFRLQKQYQSWEYVCQYNETHYNFFLRWLEREGLYYFFEQGPGGAKVVVTDTRIAHQAMPQGNGIRYSPPTGMEHGHRQELLSSFTLRQQMVPKDVRLRDYNYRTPALELQGTADVADYGRGTFYQYGEHFRTPSEGETLARIRAEGFKCREKLFHGESAVPFIRPGFVFTLEGHYRQSFNQDYLTIQVDHRGNQAAYFLAGLGKTQGEADREARYENSFTAIPAEVQFRPLSETPRPRFSGTMNAWVDASGSGKYAQIDDQGRYKIRLPFDLSGRDQGKASAWVRMAQPYGGDNHGMHFPLHKGTEVLLTCIDGDPDRPIIQATVPNPDFPSQVSQQEQTMCKITTGGQNKIHIEDKEGSQRILLHSPTQGSFVRIGAPNDPPPPAAVDRSYHTTPTENKDGITLVTGGFLDINAQAKNQIILGENTAWTVGLDWKLVAGERMDMTLLHRTNVHVGWLTDIKCGGHWTFAPIWQDMRAASSKQAAVSNEVVAERSEEVAVHEEVVGEQSEVHGALTVVNGESTHMAGESTGMFGERTEMSGESTIMAGELTLLCGELTTLIGEETDLVGEQTQMVGEQTTMAGELTVMAGESTEMAGEKTIMAGELTIMAGMTILL